MDEIASLLTNTWSRTISSSYPPQKIEFTGTLLIQLLFFWLPSFIYLFLDVLFPSFSARHKIQPAPRQPTRKDIWRCVLVVSGNQVLTTGLHALQLFLAAKVGREGSYRVEAALPSREEFVRDFILCLLLREAMFYYSHRLLHRPIFYSKIHKLHHRFTAPIALAAQYAHPIEHIFANALPISLPPQILGSHVLTFWVFLAYELFNTATVHSGYDFFAGKARMHDLHHEKFNLNYGSIGVLDWVHGTDRLVHKKRD
ncbi:hypothetical protein VTN00DRAFT_3444 [Thermoascus crustaceus]|uniref:uncharacterized protein n=1 Tax=Thermoascus crustaceus TaxID=5088 RepID=UPI0037427B91